MTPGPVTSPVASFFSCGPHHFLCSQSCLCVCISVCVSRLHLCSLYFLSYIASAECLVKFLLFFVFLSTCVKFLYLVYSCVCLLMKSVYFFICTKLLCCSQLRFPVLFIHHSIQVFSSLASFVDLSFQFSFVPHCIVIRPTPGCVLSPSISVSSFYVPSSVDARGLCFLCCSGMKLEMRLHPQTWF